MRLRLCWLARCALCGSWGSCFYRGGPAGHGLTLVFLLRKRGDARDRMPVQDLLFVAVHDDDVAVKGLYPSGNADLVPEGNGHGIPSGQVRVQHSIEQINFHGASFQQQPISLSSPNAFIGDLALKEKPDSR